MRKFSRLFVVVFVFVTLFSSFMGASPAVAAPVIMYQNDFQSETVGNTVPSLDFQLVTDTKLELMELTSI